MSPSPVGSGARAAGMADAFVAIADDATAASWNPAGLVQLERPEVSIVGSYNGVFEAFAADWHDEVDSDHSDHNFDLNYFSFVYPVPFLVLGRNASVSLNYQRKYDFTRKFRLKYNTAAATGRGTPINSFYVMDFEQEGGLSTLTPAFAIEITHRLSVGASLNFWRSSFLSDNRWEQTIRTRGFHTVGAVPWLSASFSRAEYKDFSGENYVVGLLWNVTDRWSLGARYDSAFTGTARYREMGVTLRSTLTTGFLSVVPKVIRETRSVRFPETFAGGAAYRPNDRLTLSLDVTRTDWNGFWVKDSAGVRRSLVDFSSLENPWTRPDFDPTHTVRFGAEYVFIPEQPDEELNRLWTLRGGLFYDEEPATDRSEGFRWLNGGGTGKPDRFYGLALGCGLLGHHRVIIDLAYQLRYGHEVNRDFIRGVRGFREDVFQHRALLSTVIYF